MTDEATGSTGQPELAAIEAEKNPAALENSPPARAVYADVTAPGERRPVLPHWITQPPPDQFALPARPAVHLHFHGVTAEDVAAIVQRHRSGE